MRTGRLKVNSLAESAELAHWKRNLLAATGSGNRSPEAELARRDRNPFAAKDPPRCPAPPPTHRHRRLVVAHRHRLYLSDHVVHVTLALAAVVQRQPRRALVCAEERRRLHARVGEAQVLVQVVESVEEVPQLAAEHAHDPVVAVVLDVADERVAAGVHQVVAGVAGVLVSGGDETRHERLAVALVRAEGDGAHVGQLAHRLPCLLAVLLAHGGRDALQDQPVHGACRHTTATLQSTTRRNAETPKRRNAETPQTPKRPNAETPKRRNAKTPKRRNAETPQRPNAQTPKRPNAQMPKRPPKHPNIYPPKRPPKHPPARSLAYS